MTHFVHRLTALAAGLTVAAVGISATPPAIAATLTPTEFTLAATGFTSHIDGGDLPAASGRTGFSNFACTNLAGKDKTGQVEGTEVGNPGSLAIDIGVGQSHTWSEKVGSKVSVHSEHHVADVKLLAGLITLRGINSKATAYNDGTKFGTDISTTVAGISVLGLPGIGVPTPGKPVVVPGVAEIAIGSRIVSQNETGASAKATGVKVRLLATKTTIWLAYSQADIGSGVETALFGGSASGVTVSAAGGAVVSGPTPRRALPCEGSDTWKTSSVGAVDVPGAVDVGAIDASMLGYQKAATKTADGIARTDVARVELGNGAVVIEGLRAQARVTLVAGKATRNSAYASTAKVTVNGTETTLAKLPELEIPGIARIRTGVVTKLGWNHIKVVGVEVQLLQGSAGSSVIEIGKSEVLVKPAGL